MRTAMYLDYLLCISISMKVFIVSNSPLPGRAAAMLSNCKMISIAARLSKESTNDSLLSVDCQPQQQTTLHFDSYMGDLLGETEMSIWFSGTCSFAITFGRTSSMMFSTIELNFTMIQEAISEGSGRVIDRACDPVLGRKLLCTEKKTRL